jgi:hypothetical protein
MGQTTTVTVAAHILAEIMSPQALMPLWNKYTLLGMLNTSNIDGEPSLVRKIRKRAKISEAIDDTEGVAVSSSETYTDPASVSVTPTGKVQRINTSVRALRKRLPGATRAEVIAAIESGDPAALPFLREQAEALFDSHLQRAEKDSLALFSGASKSAGTTTADLSFATFLDALYKLLDDKPEHENIVAMFDELGVKDLRTALITGSGTGLASIWTDADNVPFFRHVPDAARTGYRGACMGVPVYTADKSLMTTANAGADRVGALFCIGRGETGTPNSFRGFAEFCEGHALAIQLELDMLGDAADAVGRWETASVEHTDEHITQVIYGIT